MLSTEKTVIEPPFWDDYLYKIPLCQTLVANFKEIRNEILTFVQDKNPLIDFPKYGYYDEVAKVDRKELYEHSWKAMPLSKFRKEFDEDTAIRDQVELLSLYVQENLLFTYQMIKEYEQKGWLANAFVSKLSPGSVIHPHVGRSSLFLRVHFCLIDDPECLIKVGSQTKSWKEGKLLAFKDGGPYQHSVIHAGKRERIILSLDLLISEMRQFIPDL